MFVPFVMVCSLAILVIVLALRLRLLTAVISPDWLRRKAKTITNIASEQTITKGTNITQSVGSASNLQGGNVNINAQDITNTTYQRYRTVI
jgi:hypothetical protein